MGKIFPWKFDTWIKNLMLIFLVLSISAASFCGFFIKWSFRDGAPANGIEAMLDGTAQRPFVHRQLLPQAVKATVNALPERTKEKLSKNLIEKQHIEKRFAQASIQPAYVLEYYMMYIYCFLLFFASIWILRALLSDITKDKFAGTLGAVLFALMFPYFEVLGGYYYDIGEIFFFFLAALLALRGKIFALLLITPFAEWNKESFLFFLATLLPLMLKHYNLKKSAAITLGLMFVAGLAYLYVRSFYVGNPGDAADWRIIDHLSYALVLDSYFLTDSIYGIPLPARMFFLYIIFVIWLVKYSWRKISIEWKGHIKIAALINGILYFMFVLPGELRDLSMLYISLMIFITYFLHDIFQRHYQKEIEP